MRLAEVMGTSIACYEDIDFMRNEFSTPADMYDARPSKSEVNGMGQRKVNVSASHASLKLC